jgi:transcriptional regulator with XRE-family HTH domain
MVEAAPKPEAIPLAHAIYARAKGRFGQKALAKAAGLNDTYIRDLYDGSSKKPGIEAIDSIAGVLGCTIDDLIHPERSQQAEGVEGRAQSEEEVMLLRAWRSTDEMRDAIASAIEGRALGPLARFIKRKDV